MITLVSSRGRRVRENIVCAPPELMFVYRNRQPVRDTLISLLKSPRVFLLPPVPHQILQCVSPSIVERRELDPDAKPIFTRKMVEP